MSATLATTATTSGLANGITPITPERCATIASLYDRFYASIRGYIYSLVGQRELAADLAQDVFVRALVTTTDVATLDYVDDWLFTVARHVAYDAGRRKVVRQRVAPEVPLDALLAAGFDPVDPAGQEALACILASDEVLVALRRLSPQHRRIFRLVFIEGLTYAEVAQRLGVSTSAVKMHVMRARRVFKMRYAALQREYAGE